MMSEQSLFAELKPITFDGIDPNKPLVSLVLAAQKVRSK